MKKSVIVVLTLSLLLSVLLVATSCNRQIFDTTYSFSYARIYTPSGEILVEGTVTSWLDYDDGDQLQVVINGVTYLTHASLIILSTEQPAY